ncbi:hypothetical protein VTJ49DRAFT_2673 [Mycothermus thermophilus]|uniref:Uncharacterized protein n=1 Tax=Humicola insolens TaxID=85995 RepID=A0ABR3VAF9_HUMIN
MDYDTVVYARAGWRKRILVPMWTFQVAVLLCLMCLFAYRLAETFEHYDEAKRRGRPPTVEVVWEGSNVACNVIALVLNCLEMARKATERLTPFFMVCTHVIKVTLALAVLALDIAAYIQGIDGIYPSLGIGLDVGLLAATLVVFVYSIWTYRRLLEYETYQLASVRASAGVELGYRPPSMVSKPTITATTTTRVSYTGYDTETEYTVPYPPYNVYRDNYRSHPPQSQRLSQTQTQLQQQQPQQDQQPPSYASATTDPSGAPVPGTATTPPEKQPPPAAAASATSSSNSEPQPLSPADLRRHIDRALDAEFGWGDSSNNNNNNNNNHTTTNDQAGTGLDRSHSVVLGGGTVAVRPAGAAVAEVQRKPSWRTEVVIEDAGEAGEDGRRWRRGSDDDDDDGKEEDEQALLGGGRR